MTHTRLHFYYLQYLYSKVNCGRGKSFSQNYIRVTELPFLQDVGEFLAEVAALLHVTPQLVETILSLEHKRLNIITLLQGIRSSSAYLKINENEINRWAFNHIGTIQQINTGNKFII